MRDVGLKSLSEEGLERWVEKGWMDGRSGGRTTGRSGV